MMKSRDSLSIVLPVYNDASKLAWRVAELLDFLPELTESYLIIVVDNGSNDGTEEIAYDLEREFPQLRVFRAPTRYSSEQLTEFSLAQTGSEFVIIVGENAPISAVRLNGVWAQRQSDQQHFAVQESAEKSVADRLKHWATQLPAATANPVDASELQMNRRSQTDEVSIHFRQTRTPQPLWFANPSSANSPVS